MHKKNKCDGELSYDEFILIAEGHTAFQLLWAGIKLNLFSILYKKKLTKKDIENKINLESQPAEILLNGLCSLKLIKKSKNLYSNSKIAGTFLISQSKNNVIDAIGWQYHIVYPAEMYFLESLKKNKNIGLKYFPGKGNTIYERLSGNKKLERIFQNAMASLSNSVSEYLVKKLDLKGFKHLVDIGGGDGSNAIKIANHNSHLKISIFDIPSVCKIADANIKKVELSEQIKTYKGNFLKDKFPSDVDFILFVHIITIWSIEKNIKLFQKAYNTLPKNGQVCICNMMANDDGNGPLSATLGSPYFQTIATGEGMIYSKKQVIGFLRKAGFKKVTHIELPIDHELIIGIK